MEWTDNLNKAVQYIEEHIKEEIDYEIVASIACCSLSKFQRLFTFMADTPVSDYVRYRKMTLAAKELMIGESKIIDLALDFGYESPEAFTRAYQNFHGVPPSVSRKLGIYNKYDRVTFQINIQGGHVRMGTKPVVRIEEHGNEKVVSFKSTKAGAESEAIDLLRDWAVKNLNDYAARRVIGFAPKGHHPNGEDDSSHVYVMQMFLYEHEGREKTFKGAEVTNAPEGLFLVGDVVLNEFQKDGSVDIGMSMRKSSQVMNDCMKDMGGYDLDFNGRCFYEEHVCSQGWFEGTVTGNEFKLWLPIKTTENN